LVTKKTDITIQHKDKAVPPQALKAYRRNRAIVPFILRLDAIQMTQLQAPAILLPVKKHGTYWGIRSRVDIRAGLEFVEKRKYFAAYRDLNLGSSSPKPNFYTD
jgi:hypothetical protein